MRYAIDLDAYTRRLAYPGPLSADVETLQALVRAHVLAIPVENIDPLMAVPVELDPVAVEDKLVHARRGGSGFEHNVLLAGVLKNIGFDVTPLLARVLWQRPDDAISAPTHLVLKVELHGQAWLVDGGFQEMTPPGPLSLRDGIEQMTSHESFRLLQHERQWHLQAKLDGQWRALYRFDTQPCDAIDYRVACHYESSHPDSPSTRHLRVSRVAADCRLVLRDSCFSTYTRDGAGEHCTLSRASHIRHLLVNRFNLWLPRQGVLDQRLESLSGALDPGHTRSIRTTQRHLRLV